MRPYRCLFLDWYDTLSTDRLWGRHPALAELATPLFTPTERLSELLLPWLRGSLTSEVVVGALAGAGGVAYDVAMREFVDGCRRMAFASPAVPNLVGTLRRRGVRMVIATDNADAFRRWTVPSLGLDRLFDDILCSADIGAVKSDLDASGRSAFFDAFLRRERFGPGDTALLDDSEDVGGRIGAFGIDYYRIGPDPGQVPALLQRLADAAGRAP